MSPTGSQAAVLESESGKTGGVTGVARILIASPYHLLVDLLSNALEPEFAVIGVAYDGASFLRMAEELQPDLALTDTELPGPDSVFARLLHARAPTIRLVHLIAEPTELTAAGAFYAGVSACVSRQCSVAELRSVIRSMLGGGPCVQPEIRNSVQADIVHPLAKLSPRELQVLRLLLTGLPMQAVARQLGISPRTAAFHKYRAMSTLGLRGRGNAGLMEFASRYGLVASLAG